ncbi:hypothetical protein ACGFYY_35165 [Streptomyces sp. NPDC048331]
MAYRLVMTINDAARRALSDPMLRRWEHDPGERPDREYTKK